MKKVFLILFSLIMMCSVSFGIEANANYTVNKKSGISGNSGTVTYLDLYTTEDIASMMNDLDNGGSLDEYQIFANLLKENDYEYLLYKYIPTNSHILLISSPDNPQEVKFEFVKLDFNGKECIGFLCENADSYADSFIFYYFSCSTTSKQFVYSAPNSITFYTGLDLPEIIDSNCNVYNLTLDSGYNYYWDGVSYAYQPQESGGESGGNNTGISELTDEEIAEIVERFINSDAYLENAYYNGDYFITYDNLTGYFRGYSYAWNIDLAIEYGNYDEEGNFVTTGTKEGEAWRIRPYEFSGDIFVKFGDWLASKFNTYAFEYFSISPDSSIKPKYIGSLEHNYCSNYKENEVVIYSSKQIRYVGEETNSEGKTETVVTDNYIPPTVLKDSETGEEIIIRDNLQSSSDSLETVITPNADFSGLKQAFEKYISFIDISSITWLTTAISSMIAIFVPFVALGIIIFLINRILNGGS